MKELHSFSAVLATTKANEALELPHFFAHFISVCGRFFSPTKWHWEIAKSHEIKNNSSKNLEKQRQSWQFMKLLPGGAAQHHHFPHQPGKCGRLKVLLAPKEITFLQPNETKAEKAKANERFVSTLIYHRQLKMVALARADPQVRLAASNSITAK